MSSRTMEPMAPPTAMPDTLVEALTTVSADYFLADPKFSEDPESFAQEMRDFYEVRPHDVIAGLLVATFDITPKPIAVVAPAAPASEVVDHELFLANWHHLMPTLIDMGKFARWEPEELSENPRFDETIARRVEADFSSGLA